MTRERCSSCDQLFPVVKAVSTLSLSLVQASLTLPTSPSLGGIPHSGAALIWTLTSIASFAALFTCKSNLKNARCSTAVMMSSLGPRQQFSVSWHFARLSAESAWVSTGSNLLASTQKRRLQTTSSGTVDRRACGCGILMCG